MVLNVMTFNGTILETDFSPCTPGEMLVIYAKGFPKRLEKMPGGRSSWRGRVAANLLQL